MSVVEMKVPVIGESVTEVTLSEWFIADGEYVELDQAICEFESDKATLEFPAEAAGILRHVAAEGDDLEIGALVAKIEPSDDAPKSKEDKPSDKSAEEPQQEEEPASAEAPQASEGGKKSDVASPAAAKMMRENDLEQVQGTGKDGRILKQDVQEAVTQQNNALTDAKSEKEDAKEKDSSSSDTASNAKTSFSREERREKMSRMRRTIARRLVSAKNETAMLTTFNEVDMSPIMALRKKYQEEFVDKYGVKLGFMSLFAKACAHVLMEMPEVNAFIDGDELIYHDYADISFAISTPTGLVVPPIKNVESLHFAEIELKIKELAEKARNNKLTLAEMQGGTFTITNGGVFGSLLSTPIINEPQSAILGMHNIQQRPIAVDGQVVIRPMMYVALSYDHRVIDGSSSVTFLVRVKKLLEDPVRMLLDV